VEFSDTLIPYTTTDVFGQMLHAGIVPVITHPERNPLLQQKIDRVEKWVLAGAYVQITAQSLLGRFGRMARSASAEMIERGLAHFIASDAHDTEDRTPKLDEAYEFVTKLFGEECARALFILNPRAVLSGSPLPVRAPKPPAGSRRKWYQFWS
jgi:protein-tyrosine phosphatase